MKKLLLSALLIFLTVAARAALIPLDLIGVAGAGALAGNEPQPLTFPSTASGGEIGLGITYDTVTNVLDLTNFGWGSSQGFSDLSSPANNSHIHGGTANNNGLGFTQTAPVIINLNRSSNAVTGGTFTNPVIDLDTVFGATAEAREAELLAGKWYINIHTTNNGGGELRGFITPVPEPGTLVWGAALGLFAGCRRNRRA